MLTISYITIIQHVCPLSFILVFSELTNCCEGAATVSPMAKRVQRQNRTIYRWLIFIVWVVQFFESTNSSIQPAPPSLQYPKVHHQTCVDVFQVCMYDGGYISGKPFFLTRCWIWHLLSNITFFSRFCKQKDEWFLPCQHTLTTLHLQTQTGLRTKFLKEVM